MTRVDASGETSSLTAQRLQERRTQLSQSFWWWSHARSCRDKQLHSCTKQSGVWHSAGVSLYRRRGDAMHGSLWINLKSSRTDKPALPLQTSDVDVRFTWPRCFLEAWKHTVSVSREPTVSCLCLWSSISVCFPLTPCPLSPPRVPRKNWGSLRAPAALIICHPYFWYQRVTRNLLTPGDLWTITLNPLLAQTCRLFLVSERIIKIAELKGKDPQDPQDDDLKHESELFFSTFYNLDVMKLQQQ